MNGMKDSGSDVGNRIDEKGGVMNDTKETTPTAQQAVDMFCKASGIDMGHDVRNILAYMLDEFWRSGYDAAIEKGKFRRQSGLGLEWLKERGK